MNAAPKLKTHLPKPSQKPNLGRWFSILLFVGAGLFLVLSMLAPAHRDSKSTKAQKSTDYNNKVNEHLKMTAQKIQLQQEENRLETLKLGSRSLVGIPEQGTIEYDATNSDSVDHQWDELSSRIQSGNATLDDSLTQSLQNEIFQQQKQNELNEANKEEYARQFVENARRGGYAIELTPAPDYKIKSVKKIIPRNEPSLFGGSIDSR